MDKGDAGHGAASGQELGGETGPVIDIESFGYPVCEKGLFEDEGQGADGLRGVEGMSCDHSGVIIKDSAKDGFFGALAVMAGFYEGAVHEVADPEVVDIVYFIGLSDISSGLDGQQSPLFDNAKQGVVMHGWMA